MAASDEIARMRAEMDQAREGLKEMAGILAGFHRELVESGLSQHQALDLTKTWFSHLLGSASASGMLEQLLNGKDGVG
jgi:hypothetical protein